MRAAGRVGVAAATAICALSITACSGGTAAPRTIASEASLDAIAGRMTDMVSDNGIPIENDYVRCVPSLDGRSVECHALTATEPAKDIKGTFTESNSTGAATNCPGTLTISVGPPISDFDAPGPVSRLQVGLLDPCR